MRIAILAPSDCHGLEICGPRDVFVEANLQSATGKVYDVQVVTEAPGPIACLAGLSILPNRTIQDSTEAVDTLVVLGTRFNSASPPSPALLAWLQQHAASARRFGAVCTGAFLLGAAGLLDGRHVTTHWQYARDLAAAYPSAIVEPDRIFVRDGRLFTSAGGMAGIDLALSLVEEDQGRALALAVARFMVMFLKRPGGQSQFSAQLAAQIATRPPVEEIQQWIRANPKANLSVPELARHAGMSERHFARVFGEETRTTPADFVELTRVDAARLLLEDTNLALKQIASACGFAGSDTLRRAFLRRVGVRPLDYRARFRTARPDGLAGQDRA